MICTPKVRHFWGAFALGRYLLFHEFVDCLAQIVNGVFISSGYRIHHTVAHVVFQDHLAGVIQRGTDSGQLHQDLGAIVAFFYHAFDLFQVADGSGKAVDDGLLIFVDMTVGVGQTVGMHIGMFVVMVVAVAVFMIVFMEMFAHGNPFFLRVFPIIPYFAENCKP